MKADILRQGHVGPDDTFDPTDEVGEWVMQQDPDSGEIIRTWQPNAQTSPTTPTNGAGQAPLTSFDCIARGIVDGGIRVAGTTENFGELYENVDYVSMTVGPNVKISKRDKVTNIRNKKNIILWRDEEQPDAPPTVFSVKGVTPIPDPWGNFIEQRVMLERSEVQ
jgi:hypothetical protein